MKVYLLYHYDGDDWMPRGVFSSLEKAQQQAFDDLHPDNKKQSGWGWKSYKESHWHFALEGYVTSDYVSEFVMDESVVWE